MVRRNETHLPLGHEEGQMTRSDFQKQISPALWRVDLSYLAGSRGSELNLNSGQIRFRSPKMVVFVPCNLSSIFLCAGKQGAPAEYLPCAFEPALRQLSEVSQQGLPSPEVRRSSACEGVGGARHSSLNHLGFFIRIEKLLLFLTLTP